MLLCVVCCLNIVLLNVCSLWLVLFCLVVRRFVVCGLLLVACDAVRSVPFVVCCVLSVVCCMCHVVCCLLFIGRFCCCSLA